MNINFVKWTVAKTYIETTAETGIIKAHNVWFNLASKEGLFQSRRPPAPVYTPGGMQSAQWEEKDESTPAQTASFMQSPEASPSIINLEVCEQCTPREEEDEHLKGQDEEMPEVSIQDIQPNITPECEQWDND